MTPTMNEDFEVPDSSYDLLDRACDALCNFDTASLGVIEHGNLDILVASVLNMMHARAEQIAEAMPIPGKVANSVLEAQIPGYREALELATYLIGVLPSKDDQS